jgi:hypothetical protein
MSKLFLPLMMLPPGIENTELGNKAIQGISFFQNSNQHKIMLLLGYADVSLMLFDFWLRMNYFEAAVVLYLYHFYFLYCIN